MNRAHEISGWYGKLPGSGDFAVRGLSPEVQQRLETWVDDGLIQLRFRLPDWKQFFTLSPTWAFAVPRDVVCDTPVVGCIAPSADRVGRLFPLISLQSVHGADGFAATLPPQGRWHSDVASLLHRAQREQLSVESFDERFLELRVKSRTSSLEQGHEGPSATHAGDIFSILHGGGNGVDLALANTVHTREALPERSCFEFSWPELAQLYAPDGVRSFWWSLGAPTTKRLVHEGALTSHLFITLFTLSLRLGPSTNA